MRRISDHRFGHGADLRERVCRRLERALNQNRMDARCFGFRDAFRNPAVHIISPELTSCPFFEANMIRRTKIAGSVENNP